MGCVRCPKRPELFSERILPVPGWTWPFMHEPSQLYQMPKESQTAFTRLSLAEDQRKREPGANTKDRRHGSLRNYEVII